MPKLLVQYCLVTVLASRASTLCSNSQDLFDWLLIDCHLDSDNSHLQSLTAVASVQPYEREAARGLQYFSGVPDEDIVGKPYRHMAADMQARSCSLWRHLT